MERVYGMCESVVAAMWFVLILWLGQESELPMVNWILAVVVCAGSIWWNRPLAPTEQRRADETKYLVEDFNKWMEEVALAKELERRRK